MLDKWAYILFSINLVNGGLVLFYFPLIYEEEAYSKILTHLFGLQFASLFEAGSILFFTNLVAGKVLSEHYAYSKIISVSRLQITFALISAVSYSYLALGQDAWVAACFLCLHLFFSLYAVPRMFLACLKNGYERVQLYKAFQAVCSLFLIVIQLAFLNNINILIVSYALASFFTLVCVLMSSPWKRSGVETKFTEAIFYAAKILSSSVGWLFVNFILGGFSSLSGQPTAGQSWLIFRMADAFIAARFANRISTYVNSFRNNGYLTATFLTIRAEVIVILIVLIPTIALSWFFIDKTYTILLSAWLLLARLHSAANIFILPDFTWKNLSNMFVLLISGGLSVFLYSDENPIQVILIMWLCLTTSNFLFQKPSRITYD